jgi:hypothetical protein
MFKNALFDFNRCCLAGVDLWTLQHLALSHLFPHRLDCEPCEISIVQRIATKIRGRPFVTGVCRACVDPALCIAALGEGVRRLRGDEVSDESAVSLDDIKSFRQISSVTPGDPEYGVTTGVEFTTGTAWPRLLQRCRHGEGSRWLAARYNRPSFPLFGYDVSVLCGDGDMMEGVSSDAASFAGHRCSATCAGL